MLSIVYHLTVSECYSNKSITTWIINLLEPSDASLWCWSWQFQVQSKAFCLIGTSPLPKLMLICWKWDDEKEITQPRNMQQDIILLVSRLVNQEQNRARVKPVTGWVICLGECHDSWVIYNDDSENCKDDQSFKRRNIAKHYRLF